MASIFKRDGSWVVKWKNGAGRWVQRRTNCATKLAAQELARELERKAEFQRLGLEPIEVPVSLTFGELLDWYAQNFAGQLRSQGDRLAAEKHLRPRLGALAIPEVTTARIDEALSAAADLSPKSVNNLRGFAQTVFSKAIQRGLWKGASPVDAVPRRKVPKRAPSYLKAEEVGPVLAQVPPEWRCLFATAVYTGMRRGELVALQKVDVDLEQGEILVTRSWEAGTTKGGRARLVPIHHELRPYLAQAMRESPSGLVFPRPDGSMHSLNVDLAPLLRSAMSRAQLVDGWAHKCRRCGRVEHAASSEVRRCSKAGCGFMLWPSPKPRAIRFHDLRHTTATLLLKARVPLAVVQRILGHSSPTITAGVYGHLDVDDMRAGLEQLSFQPTEEPLAKVLPLAVGGPHGAPVVRNSAEVAQRADASREIPEALRGVEGSGPGRSRTCDLSVRNRVLYPLSYKTGTATARAPQPRGAVSEGSDAVEQVFRLGLDGEGIHGRHLGDERSDRESNPVHTVDGRAAIPIASRSSGVDPEKKEAGSPRGARPLACHALSFDGARWVRAQAGDLDGRSPPAWNHERWPGQRARAHRCR